MNLNKRFLVLATVIVAVIAALTAFDQWLDPNPIVMSELVIDLAEKALIAAGMVAIAWVTFQARDVRAEQAALRNNLTRAIARGDDWRKKTGRHLAAISSAIDAQFRDWSLSDAESDIAGLMLKGASLKEIAQLRETTEATIRQQAQSIYRKSGLSGRAELSAYFLQSLFEVTEDGAFGSPEPKVHRL